MIFQCPDCGTRIEGEAYSCPVCGKLFARPQQSGGQKQSVSPAVKSDTVSKPKPKQNTPAPFFSPNSGQNRDSRGKRPIFRWWYVPILIGTYLFGFLCGGITLSVPTASAPDLSSVGTAAPVPTARVVSEQPSSMSSPTSSSPSSQQQTLESSQPESAVSQQSSPEQEQDTSLYEITYQHCEVFSDDWGNLSCNAIYEISSKSQKPLYLQKATLDFEDSNGILIGTCNNLSCGPEIIKPGGKGYFFCNSGGVEGQVDPAANYTVVPDIKVVKSANPVMRYETSDLSITKDDNYSFMTVVGRMTNNTGKGGGLIRGTCVLLGEDGTPLGVFEAWLDSLEAGVYSSF